MVVALQNLSSPPLKKQSSWLAPECWIKTGNLKDVDFNRHSPQCSAAGSGVLPVSRPLLHAAITAQTDSWASHIQTECSEAFLGSRFNLMVCFLLSF